MPESNASLLEQLTATLYDCNDYRQSFVTLRDCATLFDALTEFRMVIHCNRRRTADNLRVLNRPNDLKIAAAVPEVENM